LDPASNTVVQASAGTGKTRLLTNRIIRLLLAGNAPGSILAISFTRKAAAQIHERVAQYLLEMAAADEERLNVMLADLGAPLDAQTRITGRGLYERVLTSVYELRTSTFHAFCQELLQRFALEAGVPPGFDVYEASGEVETAAWRALDRELQQEPNGLAARCMDHLYDYFGGPQYARAILITFLDHRSDWWAYVEEHSDPVAFAIEQLQICLDTALEDDPIRDFFSDTELTKSLSRYASIIVAHPIKTHVNRKDAIERALRFESPSEDAFNLIKDEFLTSDGRIRVFKSSQALESKIGFDGLSLIIELHDQIARRVLATLDRVQRATLLKLSRSWYVCGQRLLHHYQGLKRARGLLDFADLEWNAYRLLSSGRHAEWIQYKLDQRIDHLLIDEFQDTNPTQWHLLSPLLREMASGDPERRRSVFIVGDEKQSVYRFRRADPKLFGVARDWLVHNMDAQVIEQNVSRRSSPAIIRLVNAVFEPDPNNTQADGAAPDQYLVPDFRHHDSEHEHRWGLVELLPLIEAPARPEPANSDRSSEIKSLRNPVEQPRLVDEDQRHGHEGAVIAAKIREMIGAIEIERDNGTRSPMAYADCLILLRDRTHANAYEDALRRAGIPYIGIGRGGFPEYLEVRDLIHLLTLLVSPNDDLALAAILRSPIFSAGDEDLMSLAAMSSPTTWLERLLSLDHAGAPPHSPLPRAARLLRKWIGLADRMPVHDLLDRVYCEGDVIGRYLSAVDWHLRARVESNLKRFLELALEVDSGRYPGIRRFLSRLKALTAKESDGPDHGEGEANFVRLLTIHAAKGIEAPVVFLADTARDSANRSTAQRALVDWPAEAERPRVMYLLGRSGELDETSRALLAQDQKQAQREESNLLYVALTRARQVLCISGCEPRRGGRGWYGFIESRLRQAFVQEHAGKDGSNRAKPDGAHDGPKQTIAFEHGERVRPLAPIPVTHPAPIRVEPALTKRLRVSASQADVNPSRTIIAADPPSSPATDAELGESPEQQLADTAPRGARDRGILIHAILDGLTGGDTRTSIKTRLRTTWAPLVGDAAFESCWTEACRVVDDPALSELFDSTHHELARNELPILYRNDDGQDVFGRIDRVTITHGDVILVEYKTVAHATPDNAPVLARPHVSQLRLYAEGIRKIWPNKKLRAVIIFTRCAVPVAVDLDA
jgi:ATP-dependent helicase/nuclease subunit A